MSEDSLLLQFYSGRSPDVRGRTIEQIWQQDYEWLEQTHDYIQWLFPLNEKSRFNPNAPLLTKTDIQAFKDNANLRKNLIQSFKLMLDFYGLKIQVTQDGKETITTSESFLKRKQNWVNWGNHNYLRITRILKCLKILGIADYAQAFFQCLSEIYVTEKGEITKLTFSYWQEAVE